MLIVARRGRRRRFPRWPPDIVLAGDTEHRTTSRTRSWRSAACRRTAGDGGNITNITQPVSTQTAVDLIAGNGGSTVERRHVADQDHRASAAAGR